MTVHYLSTRQPRYRIRVNMPARVRLAKGSLSLMLGFSSVFGFLLASPHLSSAAFLVFGGVVVLAGGAASLNSLQEWRQDSLMRRTRNRPLSRGDLDTGQAACQSALLIFCGLLLLLLFSGFASFLVGLLALLLYNGVYTPLKMKTALALIPGALCGGLPPVIGWLAGGGRPDSPMILLLLLLLVLWQIPHSWLVMLAFQDDYSQLRIPSLLQWMSEAGIRRLLVSWVAALAAGMLVFSLPPWEMGGTARFFLYLSTLLLPLVFVVFGVFRPRPNYRLLFIFLNGIFFLNMLVLCGARVVWSPGIGG